VIDGQAIGKPTNATIFGDVADVFSRTVCSHFSTFCIKVDVVFDRYETMKDASRAKRSGVTHLIR
jgi:hypothetical protein